MVFAVLADNRKRKEAQILQSCLKTKKKKIEHEDDGDFNCGWRTLNGPQSLGKGIKGKELEIIRKIVTIQTTDQPEY